MNKELEKFGEIFMLEVRDRTIREYDKILNGTMKGIIAEQVRDTLSDFDAEQIEKIKWLIPKIVDTELHKFLYLIESSDEIDLLFHQQNIKELSDGLSGELYTEDGWIMKYSQERYEEI